MTKNTPKGPRSPARVMQLLELLASHTDGLTLARMSALVDTPKTSLLSLLRSLEAEGYIEVHNKTYSLGAKAFRLGNMINARMKAQSSFPSAVRPFLLALSRDSGETVLSGVLAEDGTHGIFIDIVEGNGSIYLSSVIGAQRPLFCSSFGKSLLAFQSVSFIHNYLENVDPVSPMTGIRYEISAILEDLEYIRKSGVSITMGDTVKEAGGISVPVFGAEGYILGSITLAAPLDRLKSQLNHYAELAHAAGERASQFMGYFLPYPGSKNNKRADGARARQS
ncbi:IclR family transcriptional regulator [Sneathiella sp.]|uniref:IclR family transcriptional regulator n=1 Tax=Sneathiella sp. TaxID=1964365 RepID=UPI002FE2CD92